MSLDSIGAFVMTITFGFNVRRVLGFWHTSNRLIINSDTLFFLPLAFSFRNGSQNLFPRSIDAPPPKLGIHRLPLWKIADIIAPSIALGHFFGRFGCLMTGCCYGRACNLPWAIHFPEEHWTHGKGVHPTQVYEALLNFGLFLGLSTLFRRKKFDGQVFAVYLISYAFLRAFVEMFRGDYPHYYGGVVTPGQMVSAGILVTGLLLLWKLSGVKLPKPQPSC